MLPFFLSCPPHQLVFVTAAAGVCLCDCCCGRMAVTRPFKSTPTLSSVASWSVVLRVPRGCSASATLRVAKMWSAAARAASQWQWQGALEAGAQGHLPRCLANPPTRSCRAQPTGWVGLQSWTEEGVWRELRHSTLSRQAGKAVQVQVQQEGCPICYMMLPATSGQHCRLHALSGRTTICVSSSDVTAGS